MPLEQSEAFVLRTFNVGEQDKIVVFLAKNKGIVKGIAKGARKFGNRFGSGLEPLSHVKLHYYEKEHRDLVVLNSCDLIESNFDLQRDVDRAFILSYFSELIEEFFPSREKDDILFRLLQSALNAMKAGGDLDLLGAYFETWILKINGFLPSFKKCRRCRKEIMDSAWLSLNKEGVFCTSCASHKKEKIQQDINDFFQWVKKNPPPKHKELPVEREKLRAIRKTLQGIIVYHMEREPKSLRFLK
ncbi:MAG: DNA repair protein RecO [Candidatus Aminicenantes bacterium]|nr:MAG: DNA repair protein RecO [Candidatus Aminicenantes bacterium]